MHQIVARYGTQLIALAIFGDIGDMAIAKNR
jgi:hypothetical protein